MLILSIFAVLALYETADGQARQYIFSSKPMNWTDAQSYCRQAYTDLATITTNEENQRATDAGGSSLFNWIGLTESVPKSNKWTWSDGEDPMYFKWVNAEPLDNFKTGNCVSVGPFGWFVFSCSMELHVLCQWRIILVTKSMTWDEAMNYCKTHYRGLVFLTAQTEHLLAQIGAVQASSVSVWVGLRFLDGNWLWVNGQPMKNLVSCSAPAYRCGALNTETGIWENRDCNEQLNFMCF